MNDNLSNLMTQQINAILIGIQKFLDFLPIYTKQQISVVAKRKLDSTYQEYINAVSMEYQGDLFVIELDPDNFLANALEDGVDSFSLKNRFKNNKGKFKVSKEGFLYQHIPMSKSKAYLKNQAENTTISNYDANILRIMNRNETKLYKTNNNLDGTVTTIEQYTNLSGFYKIKKYKTTEDFIKKKAGHTTNVLFRTMSNNPESQGKWQHPGLDAKKIFPESEILINNNVQNIFDQIINNELSKIM